MNCQNLDDPVIVVSYMRSGTHLTMDFLRRNFRGVGGWKFPGEPNDQVYLPIDALGTASWGLKRTSTVISRSRKLLCKTHWADPNFSQLGKWGYEGLQHLLRDRARIIFVYRSPYKVIDSNVVWKIATGDVSQAAVPSDEWLDDLLTSWGRQIDLWRMSKHRTFWLSAEKILANPSGVNDALEGFLGCQSRKLKSRLPAQLRGRLHSRLNRAFSWKPSSTEILTIRPAPSIVWSQAQRSRTQQFWNIYKPILEDLENSNLSS